MYWYSKHNTIYKNNKIIIAMKSRVIEKCRNSWSVLAEKCLEWTQYFWDQFTLSNEYCSNLTEEYSIKREFLKEDYVKEFIKEREKAIKQNRYRMELKERDGQADDNCTIGYVTLYRKKDIIDRAALVIKPGESTRLIYWKFEKQ